MAAATILKIGFLAITHQPIVWFQRNFALGSRTAWRQKPRDKNCNCFKCQMADFDKIWHTDSLVTKNWNFQNSRCWRPPSWKSIFFDHNSTDCSISAKFCMRKHNGMSTRATWRKLQIIKIQDCGRPPFWKSLNRHISVKNRSILMKFGTL